RFRRRAHHCRTHRRQPRAAIRRAARALPRPHRHPLRAPRRPYRRRPPRQVRPRLSPRRSLTEHARQSAGNTATIGSTTSRRLPASASSALYSVAEAVAGSPSRYVSAAPRARRAILPSRPARATRRRAQRRSRMARLRATASAARSILDGREHDGRLDRVGAAISLYNKQTIKRRPRKTIKKRTHAHTSNFPLSLELRRDGVEAPWPPSLPAITSTCSLVISSGCGGGGKFEICKFRF